MPLIYHYTLFRVNILTICLYYAGNIWLIYLLQAIYGQYTDRFITIVPNYVMLLWAPEYGPVAGHDVAGNVLVSGPRSVRHQDPALLLGGFPYLQY